MNRLAAYKVKHGDCHFPQDYKDDTELATWVNNVQQRHTKLTEKQERTHARWALLGILKKLMRVRVSRLFLNFHDPITLLKTFYTQANKLECIQDSA